MYKIPADETGASCYDDFHCMLSLSLLIIHSGAYPHIFRPEHLQIFAVLVFLVYFVNSQHFILAIQPFKGNLSRQAIFQCWCILLQFFTKLVAPTSDSWVPVSSQVKPVPSVLHPASVLEINPVQIRNLQLASGRLQVFCILHHPVVIK